MPTKIAFDSARASFSNFFFFRAQRPRDAPGASRPSRLRASAAEALADADERQHIAAVRRRARERRRVAPKPGTPRPRQIQPPPKGADSRGRGGTNRAAWRAMEKYRKISRDEDSGGQGKAEGRVTHRLESLDIAGFRLAVVRRFCADSITRGGGDEAVQEACEGGGSRSHADRPASRRAAGDGVVHSNFLASGR